MRKFLSRLTLVIGIVTVAACSSVTDSISDSSSSMAYYDTTEKGTALITAVHQGKESTYISFKWQVKGQNEQRISRLNVNNISGRINADTLDSGTKLRLAVTRTLKAGGTGDPVVVQSVWRKR